ncbi:MAG: DMT family transporter [Lautropia sp.]
MKDRLALAAAAATGVQVGAAIVATRFVVGETTPGALAMMRYAIGFLCLLPAAVSMRRVRFERRDLLPIALLGITQFGILVALLNVGLQTVPAARAALIFACFPLLTMLLAAALGHERLTLAKAAGVVVTIAGVGVALGVHPAGAHGAPQAAGVVPAEWRGMLAVAAATLCGAACSVLYRPYLRKYPTVPVSAFAMLASVVFLALVAALEGFFRTPLAITPTGWAAIAFIGASSGIGYFLWLWALRHAPATSVAVFLGLSPITAALLGVVLLGEPLTAGVVLGTLLVLAGLWVAHRPAGAAAAPAA